VNPTRGARVYRKLPVCVEAIRWDGTVPGATDVIDWVLAGGGHASYRDAIEATPDGKGHVVHPGPGLIVQTLEGLMTADPGDFIIRGVAGEFYPCKAAIFEQTYEHA
jgi:hypothetical protein